MYVRERERLQRAQLTSAKDGLGRESFQMTPNHQWIWSKLHINHACKVAAACTHVYVYHTSRQAYMVIDMVAPPFTKHNVSNTILGNNAYVHAHVHAELYGSPRFGVYMSNFGGSRQEVTIIIAAKMDVLFFGVVSCLGLFFLKLDRISFKGSWQCFFFGRGGVHLQSWSSNCFTKN